MTIDSIDAIFYTLAFVVPGFIAHSVLLAFIPGRQERTESLLLRFLTLSAFNYALWSWLIFLLIHSTWFHERAALTAMLWAFVILFAPALLGVGLGVASQRNLIRRILWRFGLRPVHAIPMAWDWHFSRMQSAHWVLVTLQDGSTVAGEFGASSFASSDAECRDLYVEQLYSLDGQGNWTPEAEGKGILLTGDQIRSIEFWPKK